MANLGFLKGAVAAVAVAGSPVKADPTKELAVPEVDREALRRLNTGNGNDKDVDSVLDTLLVRVQFDGLKSSTENLVKMNKELLNPSMPEGDKNSKTAEIVEAIRIFSEDFKVAKPEAQQLYVNYLGNEIKSFGEKLSQVLEAVEKINSSTKIDHAALDSAIKNSNVIREDHLVLSQVAKVLLGQIAKEIQESPVQYK